jgi:N-acetylglucosamine-6-sulfatase
MRTNGTEAGSTAPDRIRWASIAALIALGFAVALPTPIPPDPTTLPPNVLIVITDDQTIDTLPADPGPAALPWLQSRILDPQDHWIRFPRAFISTPLCCPSRASILTGLASTNTGVGSNEDGGDLDESSTLATWLHDAGYTTALVGKYLNGFPWDRGPYVPAGWDRFVAKLNQERTTTYYEYQLLDQGVPLFVGRFPDGYATSFLADEAAGFLRAAPSDRPWFLVYAPPAPHAPWTPAAGDRGAFSDTPLQEPSLRTLNDVRGKPAWVRSLPPITAERREELLNDRRRARETLLAVDRAVRSLLDQVQARGELERTVVIFLTDNGFSFGEHRWVGKRCPYEACVRTPLAIRVPWSSSSVRNDLVSNLDLASTIAELVAGFGYRLPGGSDGVSLVPLFGSQASTLDRDGVLLQYEGDRRIPAWNAVRTQEMKYIEYADGSVELYDLTGVVGRADPSELVNVADRRPYAGIRVSMQVLLGSLLREIDHG